MSGPSQRVHDSSHSILRRLILRRAWAVQECSTAADKYETSILLLICLSLAILTNKVVRGEFRCVQHALEVHVHYFEIWLLGAGSVVGEDLVLTGYPGICNYIVDLPCG
jgi:hypothetical protein